MLKITCILTSYNRPIGVAEAIASVQAQTYPNWELIIVDDNSNSITQSILKDIVSKDKRCKLIQSGVRDEDRMKTARYATCINMAIPFITGDLVTYLTDDDIFYPQRFEKMVKVFRRNPAIHVVYGRQKVVVLNNEGAEVSHYIRPLLGVTRSPEYRVDHNSFMHRLSCLDIIKGWDDDPALWTHADIGFFKRLVKHWDFYPLDFITDEHRIHGKGIGFLMSSGKKPHEKGEDSRFALNFQLNKLVNQIIEAPSTLTGWLDSVTVEGLQVLATGWARNPFTGEAGEEVVIVNQNKQILSYTKVALPREDVAANLKDSRLLRSGWSVTIEKNLLPAGNNSISAYLLIRKAKMAIRLSGEFKLEN